MSVSLSYPAGCAAERRNLAAAVAQNLNIRVKLVTREFNVHWKMVLDADYSGVADYAMWPLFLDPYGFLDQFANDAKSNPSGGPIPLLPRS